MMAADTWWQDLWLLVLSYPWLSLLFLVLLCAFGTLVALALLSGNSQRIPLYQWEDDREQHDAVTRPGALEKPTHQVHIAPASNVVPWGRRVQPPATAKDRP